MPTHNYDPKLNIIVVAGVPLQGVDSIEVSQKEDDNSLKVSADGTNNTFVVNNDKQCSIKISIEENSISVPLMEAAIAASNLTGATFAITITNMNSGRKQAAAECKLGKKPDSKLDKDDPMLDYSFITPQVKGESL